jgi:hypothetical protein
MIPVTIADKKYRIKSISELTTREFIELNKIEELTFIKYIAWQTSTDLEKAFFTRIDKLTEQSIGVVPDIRTLKRSKRFDYKKTIQTVGQRHQVEGCNLTNFELLVFCLAVSQAQSNNIDDVIALRDAYMQQPFTEILPSGFFFFKNLEHGKSFAQRILMRFSSLMKIRK